MIITEFHIRRFLGGNPLRLLDLGQGLNVALVDHCQSKRELLDLVPWVLFGRRLRQKQQSQQGLSDDVQSGEAVHLRTENGVFQVSRPPEALADQQHPPLAISTPDGRFCDEDYLNTLLDGITVDQFRKQFT